MATSVGAVLVVVLVGGQLAAPPIATTILRHRLATDGRVISVRISALPWFQLLWQHADRVAVRMASYHAARDRIPQLLDEAEGVGTLEVEAGQVHTGLLTLHDVSFSKHADELLGSARVELRDLRAALPIVRSLTPVDEAGGRLLLRGTVSVLGVNAAVDLVVTAVDGKLVVAPTGLLGAFATLTLFDDPKVDVRSVDAGAVPGGVRFVVRGRMR